MFENRYEDDQCPRCQEQPKKLDHIFCEKCIDILVYGEFFNQLTKAEIAVDKAFELKT